MTVNEKIAALRQAARDAGGHGVLVMTSDPHNNEYLPDHYNALPWFTGFTGENATLVVTLTGSALWVDGRFYVQGDKQLAGTEITCMHAGAAGVPTVEEYLAANFTAGQTLLLDGSCAPAATVEKYRAALEKAGAALAERDLVSPLWQDRPALPDTPCFLLSVEQTGAAAAEKLAALRTELHKAGATALAVPALDCLGWLLNLRARDLPCTPLAVAFGFVTDRDCTLFIAPGRLTEADAETLARQGVALRGYEEFLPYVQALADETVLVDKGATNYALYAALTANPRLKVVEGRDPITALKGVKNPVELKNLRECHIRDGVAMVRFEMDLEKALAEGRTLHETDIEEMLKARRREQPGYLEDSFETIAAWGPNAAMMHYHAVKGGPDAEIRREGLLLVDTGGQYDCGTTDITRTYSLEPAVRMSDEDRQFYTRVLQAHIEMARAKFLDYATGFALDTFARGPLWAHKINYRCGTGHSVGYISSVHEGPQSLRPHNEVVFQPGMTITDEPGIYETDKVGIRIENELECVDAGTNQYGRWLAFEPLTFVPINLDPVIWDEMTVAQRNWINNYHAKVYHLLAPRLNKQEKEWLARKCAPLVQLNTPLYQFQTLQEVLLEKEREEAEKKKAARDRQAEQKAAAQKAAAETVKAITAETPAEPAE